MDAKNETEHWVEEILPKHRRLTESVVIITKSLLDSAGIDFLSVSGRTKTKDDCLEKIKRKSYKKPALQLTDISGIRIIVFIESDISKVSTLIQQAFNIDTENSSDKDKALGSNQVGYRSIHYVADLGEARCSLPEFHGFNGLRFEFQIRTVLQHAWAELAHDRSYKFQEGLPLEIQRNLFLHAGLLEIADKGFSQISQTIDDYKNRVDETYEAGEWDIPIDRISLIKFIEKWADTSKFKLDPLHDNMQTDLGTLINELKVFGISTIAQLRAIIPAKYADKANEIMFETTIFGLIRDWMIIHDARAIRSQGVTWDIYVPDNEDFGDGVWLKFVQSLTTADNFEYIQNWYYN